LAKRTIAELEAELKRLRSQVRAKKKTTSLKTDISHARHAKHAASFAELVGKFRRAGLGFAAAARRASKEYRSARRTYGKARKKYGGI